MEPHREPTLTLGERVVTIGIGAGTFGVAAAMLPGSYNPFGPIKALVLLAACTAIAIGFALEPELLAETLRRFRRSPGAWAGLALVGLVALSVVTSVDPSQSIVGHYPEYQGLLLLLASGLVGFAAFALAENDATRRILTRIGVVAILVISAYALIQFAGADPVMYERAFTVRRVRSMLGNGSNLGVWLAIAVPLVISRFYAENGPWRWACWGAAGSGTLTLVWALSRGAWVGVAAAAGVWLLAKSRGWERGRRLATAAGIVAITACALGLVIALVPGASGRFTSIFDPSTGTANWRTEVWSASTDLVAERPLLGYGPSSFRYVFPPVRTAAMQAGETGTQALDDPHNLFVSTAVSSGVLALLALVWLLAAALRGAWRRGPRAERGASGPALAASIVAGAVALQFHFPTIDTAPLFAAVLGIALGGDPALHGGEAAAPLPARARVAARTAAGLAAVMLATVTVLAGGLTLADREVAAGYATVSAGGAWENAKPRFEQAARLAPWEPAMPWALGRAATESMQRQGSDGSFPDAATAMDAAVRRLPYDPLAVAQAGDAYLIGGLVGTDPTRLTAALPLVNRAIMFDPENGYRWAAKATALAALGQTAEATELYTRAVQYAPNDTQAWTGLAAMYDRTGQSEKAAEARARAAATVQ